MANIVYYALWRKNMKIFSKLIAMLLICITGTQLTCMNRLFRPLKVQQATFQRAAFSMPHQLTASSLARSSIFNKIDFMTVVPRTNTPSFFHKPIQHTARASFFTRISNKFFRKANDPAQFEKDVRNAITENKIEQLNDVMSLDQELLKGNRSTFVRAPRSVSYLIQASEYGNKEITNALLAHCKEEINERYENLVVGVDGSRRLSYADHVFVTPLSVAVQHHHHDLMLKLLEHKADPNIYSGDPRYPTVLAKAAIKYQDLQVVKALLEHGALVECHGYNILTMAKNRFTDHYGIYEKPILDLLKTHSHSKK